MNEIAITSSERWYRLDAYEFDAIFFIQLTANNLQEKLSDGTLIPEGNVKMRIYSHNPQRPDEGHQPLVFLIEREIPGICVWYKADGSPTDMLGLQDDVRGTFKRILRTKHFFEAGVDYFQIIDFDERRRDFLERMAGMPIELMPIDPPAAEFVPTSAPTTTLLPG